MVEPERTAGGRRLYSRDDVERLRFVGDRIAQGFSAADAHRLLREWLEGAEPPGGVEQPRPSPGQRVLLAERDPYGAELSQYFLRNEGYVVDLALSAEAAERAFEDQPPALAIVELLISGAAGAGLCARLKRLAPPVPVLAISSLHAREQALDAGADAFLQKPLDPLQLVSAVKDLLGRSALVGGSAG
jgi:CheY-like chemotaxis protein